ncbi:hypothetical protein GGR21_002233 [Dysgonomonas hofstadii]|uniref:DUF3592 domain-containing protein n=1 Tax=Dysgonomonas hofstadii TaxID=637886 RepID=A0A840CMJ3_9BACT|nr:DUF3592 domain-containing protein [Dysgonomonas hofstadii]MBB4036331.1 hypothetical protein [Dysgonomonas hofstadii]
MIIFAYFTIFSIAAALFVSACYFYRKSKNTLNWDSVEGTVCESKIDKYITTDPEVSYKAVIRYSYTVDGKEYTSTRIFFGDILREGFSFKSKRLIKKYFRGMTVDVHYNPSNPEESVLQKGVHSEIILMFVASFLLIIFACIFHYLDKTN